MSDSAGLADLTAQEIVAGTRAGEFRAADVAQACLERIVADEGSLCAWEHVDPEAVLAEARARDASTQDKGAPVGALHGVPVGVKDVIDVAGLPTGNGSPVHAGNRPSTDATAVARLRAAGAVVLGKTVTTEFALFNPAATRNPHDPERTPGGSSSGSAAAVAASMVPIALGTQTAGSIVRPASFCGVVGAKPSFSLVPTTGVLVSAPSLDTVGVFTRTVDDAGLALGVLAGDPGGFAPPAAAPPRLGFWRSAHWEAIEPACRAVVEEAVAHLAEVTDVVEVTLPEAFDALADAQSTIMAVEVLRSMRSTLDQHAELLSGPLREYLAQAETRLDAYDEALASAARARAMLPQALDGLDALLTPSVLGEAPQIDTTGDPLLCRTWTLLGAPSVAVPGLLGPSGCPLGIQLVAPAGGDAALLGAGRFVAEQFAARIRTGAA